MRDGFCLGLSLCIFVEIERRCGGMKEMIYSAKRLNPAEILADGENKEYYR